MYRLTRLPDWPESQYSFAEQSAHFTVDSASVMQYVQSRRIVIIDIRPSEYYAGLKSDQARAGHVPGAINRPFTEDIKKIGGATKFKSRGLLAGACSTLVPSQDSTVIVHCRVGHQASETFFVPKHLLGHRNVLWCDWGWNEWARRPGLSIEVDSPRDEAKAASSGWVMDADVTTARTCVTHP